MRTHYCGELSATLVDRTVTLCGWAHRRRDHGGVIFIDLRDREGMVQVVFRPERAEPFRTAERIRNEFVLAITGKVSKRPPNMVNPRLATGDCGRPSLPSSQPPSGTARGPSSSRTSTLPRQGPKDANRPVAAHRAADADAASGACSPASPPASFATGSPR